MIKPINQNDVNFKSGPWYANALTYVTRPDSFGPIIALETTVDTGRAIQAHKRGGKDEMRERMIEDITSGIVWLFGVKSLNSLGDKILKKVYGENFDVGTDKLLRTPFENFMRKNQGKKFAANPKTVAVVKAVKVLTSIILADGFIGLVLPKINQKITRNLRTKNKETSAENNNITVNEQNTSENADKVAFKGGGGLAAINVFTNAIENTNIGKLLSTDAGLISGRMYSARNNDERREIAIRDIGSLYFYMFATVHVANLLNKLESGHFTRLNPDSVNILTEHLTKFLEANGKEMSVEEFKKLVLGNSQQEISANVQEKLVKGELSKLAKLFKSKKEPLQVAKVSDLEGLFSADIMKRIKEMSKLQPLRQGEAVITKQQIIDAMNVAETNNPELLHKIFDKFTDGAYKNELKYVSNDKLYNLKAEMETYIKDLIKKAKDGKITEDMLNKAKNRNLIMSGINFAAGFAVAALFLSTLIPKLQYWVTKKKTGVDAFPGTYEYEKNQEVNKAS